MKTKSSFIIVSVILLLAQMSGCTGEKVPADEDIILVNQVGYAPGMAKTALLRSRETKYEIVSTDNNRVVFRGEAGKHQYWPWSGDSVRKADFTGLTEPGRYMIRLHGSGVCSGEFMIGENIYHDVLKGAVKALWYNRSGYEITKDYGSLWARNAGHPDTAVVVHESAASPSRPAGTVISSPGGWYDAGDYNKYIVNSAISTYTMLLLCQVYPEYCDTIKLDIPERNNDIPDITDEALYNLRWMLTMQDPADGGVYHKLTNKDFGGFEMPDRATEPRYVVQKSTQATLDFAATMAMASRLFAGNVNETLEALSVTCRNAALKAMKWAEMHPGTIYTQPADIHTGEYGGKKLDDEWFWATAEVALMVNEPQMLDAFPVNGQKATLPFWGDVAMAGMISLALTGDDAFASLTAEASSTVTAFADTLMAKYISSPYLVTLGFFRWGSNSDVANQAMMMLLAYRLTEDKKYLPAIQGDIDYILGRNATGYCFVTGYGSKSPKNIHHRPSGADNVPEPVPGFLVGGPNTDARSDCGKEKYKSEYPAKSYTDAECSYSTNEICINWNTPLIYVLGAYEAEVED